MQGYIGGESMVTCVTYLGNEPYLPRKKAGTSTLEHLGGGDKFSKEKFSQFYMHELATLLRMKCVR